MNPLRFHFDFISPYAYVGWHRVKRIAAKHGRALEPVPVVFAALLDAHGTRGPAEVPAKRAHLVKDVFRKARRAGLPLSLPPAHPFNPILALRVATIPLAEEDRIRVIDALYDAAWGSGGGVETPEQVARALRAAGRSDATELLARATEPEVKSALRSATDAAIAAGVFGVPTVLAGDEMFWGVDTLDALEEHLAGEDPIPTDLVARWSALPSSATRRG